LGLIDADAKQEILAEGFDWTEGPLWVEDLKGLLFTDIPKNAIHIIKNDGELKTYLTPSGYTGKEARGGEVGANGLILNSEGFLVLCQHGDRRMAQMISNVDNPKPEFLTLADNYQGKRLNSPNDGVYDRLGNLYFTDPPYGLEFNMDDPAKELDFQGIYCLKTDGELVLVDSISRPNGITFSPDQSQLLVANSDPKQAVWYQYDIVAPGVVANRQLFLDATEWVGKDGYKGLPDGMKMHPSGNLFASGPGGIWVFNPSGKPIARIFTGEATSNCAFSADKKMLFMTADGYVLRVGLR
jgi:gluconolactonase